MLTASRPIQDMLSRTVGVSNARNLSAVKGTTWQSAVDRGLGKRIFNAI